MTTRQFLAEFARQVRPAEWTLVGSRLLHTKTGLCPMGFVGRQAGAIHPDALQQLYGPPGNLRAIVRAADGFWPNDPQAARLRTQLLQIAGLKDRW